MSPSRSRCFGLDKVLVAKEGLRIGKDSWYEFSENVGLDTDYGGCCPLGLQWGRMDGTG